MTATESDAGQNNDSGEDAADTFPRQHARTQRFTLGAPRDVTVSTRVDKVGARPQVFRSLRATVAILFTVIMLIPVVWLSMTAFKSRPDAVAVPPKVFFQPTLEGFVSLLTSRRQLSNAEVARYEQRDDLNFIDRIALKRGQAVIGRRFEECGRFG